MASNPYWFPTGVTEGYLDDEVVLAAKKVGASNLGVFYCAEQAICAEEMAPLRATAARLGVPVVYAAAISASAPNYTAQCLAAEHAGTKALFIADAVTVDLSAAASCLQQGYRPTEIAVDGAVALSFETAPAMQGLIAAQPDVPFFVDNTPATREMHAAMARYEPAALSSPNYTEEVTQAWIAAKLFQAAVLAAAGPSGRLATVTPAEVLAGLYALHGTTLGGMAPPLTFVRGQPHTIGCWFWMRVQSDRFTTPYGLSPVCAPSSS
jgi:branched-chain amino acid transport system substrate-binding protein